jgi:signal transduction histidine kinase
MVKLRMRTKFLLSMLLISAGLTSTSLLVVRHSVQAQVKKGIFADLQNSVSTFQNFQRERELTLTHSAQLLADMPNLRALMTTQDEATIQDGSSGLSQLAGSDLFVLADRSGHVVALHTATPGLTRDLAQESLHTSLTQPGPEHWWYGNQHLYEVFLKPIYFGAASENRELGFLVIGYEIEDRVAAQVSRIAASQVAFYYGDTIVRSTLSPSHESELARQHSAPLATTLAEPEEVQLGDERFLGTSLELATKKTPSVRLTVLKSYDQATAFLDSLNHLLLALGLAAVLAGSLLVFLISHTFTRPLGSLVAGVRALGKGDFDYPLDAHGGDEVAEVTGAFKRMRDNLLQAQQELIEAERLATIGRMASSISHDLRHSLAAIVANAEFLCESRLTTDQREELYQEVRIAVNAMTDLIDSLLEFSRTRESLRPTYGNVKETLERVIQSVRARPEYHLLQINVTAVGNSTGWFDSRKLERVFYNLLQNACEAVAADRGHIDVELREIQDGVTVRVGDNGRGIPEAIRGRLFEPFVSYGKENGTGLGLTIVHKIVQDHGGNVTVERTSDEGTVFKVVLPLTSSPNGTPESRGEHRPVPPPLARTKNLQSE